MTPLALVVMCKAADQQQQGLISRVTRPERRIEPVIGGGRSGKPGQNSDTLCSSQHGRTQAQIMRDHVLNEQQVAGASSGPKEQRVSAVREHRARPPCRHKRQAGGRSGSCPPPIATRRACGHRHAGLDFDLLS